MDADFSGTLNQEELAEMLRRTYGMNPSPDELSQLIAVCDKSGDGPPTPRPHRRSADICSLPPLLNSSAQG